MASLSFDMGTLAANSQLSVQGNRGTFNAQPNAQGLAVFNITAADLDKIGEIQFNLNGADTAIVNVSGRTVNLNDNFLGGTNNLGENVIWNFPDAEELTLSTAWGGSVLAPLADAETRNYIQGSGVFGNLKQNGEMHIGTFKGGYVTPPSGGTSTGGDSSTGGGTSSGGDGSSSGGAVPVPEPGMFGLFGLGVGGLILWRRRRAERDPGGQAEGLIAALRSRWTVEAVAGDRAVDDVTAQAEAHFSAPAGVVQIRRVPPAGSGSIALMLTPCDRQICFTSASGSARFIARLIRSPDRVRVLVGRRGADRGRDPVIAAVAGGCDGERAAAELGFSALRKAIAGSRPPIVRKASWLMSPCRRASSRASGVRFLRKSCSTASSGFRRAATGIRRGWLRTSWDAAPLA